MPLHQHSLSLAVDEASHRRLLSSAPSTRSRALALSSALPHAGDWLNGIPSAALGLHLQDRCCLQYWLGVPLHSSPYSCPECHCTADIFGDHQVGCGGMEIGSCGTMPSGTSSSVPPSLLLSIEFPNLISDSLSRPADIYLPTWSRGRPAALDVHVISPLQQQTLGEAASPQATLCWLVSNGSSPLIFSTVGQRDWSSSLSCFRLWGVLRRTPFLLYAVLVDPLP